MPKRDVKFTHHQRITRDQANTIAKWGKGPFYHGMNADGEFNYRLEDVREEDIPTVEEFISEKLGSENITWQ